MAQAKLSPTDPVGQALSTIAAHAGAADRGEVTLAADLALLHHCGVLSELARQTSPGGDTLAGATLLRRIGRASLAVGRIVEGHANALLLIHLYGTSAQRMQATAAAGAGALFGVWGAEGTDPVTVSARHGNTMTLSGAKQFCSGIGLLSWAVVPVTLAEGPQLFLVDVRDPDRGDLSTWQVSGMRATASGRYDLTGLTAQTLGLPGDFTQEPHFEGGIWRYCALHCGGLEALAEEARRHILSRQQADDPHQRARLAHLAIHAQTARLWVESCCTSVVTDDVAAPCVTQALLAREAVEQACLSGIALAERILGTQAFASRSPADRIRRDLAFFLRQANLDGKLAKAGTNLLARTAPLGECVT
ncbi:acyl-CoA dehydrogenase family protein [Pseudotabrizicola sp. 4114]|uniref:acyl-CoA dehydrogenase family protein n=1 Tax=Pseudotabrizicola sp. 4114 TaxID=2817731 RepID=UPI00285ADD95|nr:alkylation response protein AidB-like acyl-CoA dehydrogenase [Pseudorhodobacter sp. 4114]